jgi:hypothetical protein
VKKTVIVFPLILALFGFGCGGAKGEKGIVKLLPQQIEQAIQNAGPFNVDVELVRKGKVYDVRVDLKNITTSELDWSKIPPDERVVRFAMACIVPVGLVAIEHEDDMEFRDLIIAYKKEVWSLSMDDCVYFTTNAIAGTMTEEEFHTELLKKLRQVE